MNAILQFVQEHKILVALVGGCIVGLLIGLLFGWVLWPVEYYNATPSHLRSDFQEDYLLWVAEQYERDGDQESARERFRHFDYHRADARPVQPDPGGSCQMTWIQHGACTMYDQR